MQKKNILRKSAQALTNCKKNKCSNINKKDKIKTGKCILKNCDKQLKNFQRDFSNSLRLVADEMNKNRSPNKVTRRRTPNKHRRRRTPGKNRRRTHGKTRSTH